jgi:hypothetical protein
MSTVVDHLTLQSPVLWLAMPMAPHITLQSFVSVLCSGVCVLVDPSALSRIKNFELYSTTSMQLQRYTLAKPWLAISKRFTGWQRTHLLRNSRYVIYKHFITGLNQLTHYCWRYITEWFTLDVMAGLCQMSSHSLEWPFTILKRKRLCWGSLILSSK